MKHSRALTIYLTIVTALLISALGMGVYVWYTFQKFNRESKPELPPQTEQTAPVATETDTQGAGSLEPVSEPKTVEVGMLSETQQSVLQAFGVKSGTVTITRDMITCAEDAVGRGRLVEITNGAAPTPPESRKLLPCFES